MSYKGKYLRGEKWYHLCPDTTDSNKLEDINLYLEAKKKAEEEAKPKSKGRK